MFRQWFGGAVLISLSQKCWAIKHKTIKSIKHMSRHNSHATETIEDIGSVLEQGKELAGNVRNKVMTTAKKTHQAVQESPYKAIAIAAGVGILVGIFLARRGSSKPDKGE
jgi:ElaB/YqjD/DUF883 family membrane-anchored ribosome-binding protein